MASVYGYITPENLELRAGFSIATPGVRSATEGYSSKLTKYTDAVIEANISQGEREINTKTGQTFTGTIPDAIINCTIELAYRRMYNLMVWDGVMDRENPKKRLMPLWDDDLMGVISPYIAKNVAPISLHRTYTDVRFAY